jgi:cytochrome P450
MTPPQRTRIDLSTSAPFAEGPPWEHFSDLREHEPVSWNDSAEGPGFWSLTRFADVDAVVRDWRTFSSERRGIFLGTILPLELQRLGFSTMDPPGHDRHRALLSAAFTPKVIESRSADTTSITRALLDGVAGRPQFDFVTEVAVELPLRVTSNLLGVPAADRHKLFRWANQMADTELPLAEVFAMFGEMTEYVLQLRTPQGGSGGRPAQRCHPHRTRR